MGIKQKIKNSMDVVLLFAFRLFVKPRDAVLFDSFSGSYSDNPKYISEKLHAIRPDIPIYWLLTDANMERKEIPSYIHKVRIRNRVLYHYYGYRCKVQIDNFAGIRSHSNASKFRKFIIQSPKLLGISTWHGTPLKFIGHDFKKTVFMEPNVSSARFAVAGCEFTKQRLKSAYPFWDILMTGTPRNDILVNKDVSVKELKKKLKLPEEYNLILFAPTYRNNEYDSGIRQIKEIDFKRLHETLKNKWGGKWAFIYRLHPHVDCSKINVDNKTEDMIMINGNEFEDMAEYLAVSDLLITDYSGSLFDFMLLDKPCVLLTLDKEHYESVERGTYMDLDDLPYPFACTVDELYQDINDYDLTLIMKKKNDFLKWLGSIEDGKAAGRIARMVVEYLDTGKLPADSGPKS